MYNINMHDESRYVFTDAVQSPSLHVRRGRGYERASLYTYLRIMHIGRVLGGNVYEKLQQLLTMPCVCIVCL